MSGSAMQLLVVGILLLALNLVGCGHQPVQIESGSNESGSKELVSSTTNALNEVQTIDVPLVELAASVAEGQRIFVHRDIGHCVLCHRVADLDVPFQGDLGPDLSDVGSRLSPGQLRLRIVDSGVINPASVMPPYHRVRGLWRVVDEHAGRPILSASQVEHLVAYLMSLSGRSPRE